MVRETHIERFRVTAVLVLVTHICVPYATTVVSKPIYITYFTYIIIHTTKSTITTTYATSPTIFSKFQLHN